MSNGKNKQAKMYRDEFRCLYPLPGVLGGILTKGNQLSVMSSWIKNALIITYVYSYMYVNKDHTSKTIIFILIHIHGRIQATGQGGKPEGRVKKCLLPVHLFIKIYSNSGTCPGLPYIGCSGMFRIRVR